MRDMRNMVCGFVTDGVHVVLLRKEHPPAQAGRYNGVGGAIRDDENAAQAMSRKCHEETGLSIPPNEWEVFAIRYGLGYRVLFYVAVRSDLPVPLQPEGRVEVPRVVPLAFAVQMLSLVPDLHFLLPFLAVRQDYTLPLLLADRAGA